MKHVQRDKTNDANEAQPRTTVMQTKFTVALSVMAGVAIGGLAANGLHEQGARTAYSASRLEIKVDEAQKAYLAETLKAEITLMIRTKARPRPGPKPPFPAPPPRQLGA